LLAVANITPVPAHFSTGIVPREMDISSNQTKRTVPALVTARTLPSLHYTAAHSSLKSNYIVAFPFSRKKVNQTINNYLKVLEPPSYNYKH
jgi:hypothetical protein